MAQVTIYLPDEVEKKVREAAQKMRKSLSAYMAELATRDVKPTRWPRGFAQLYGSWEGEFPRIEDLAVEEREPL